MKQVAASAQRAGMASSAALSKHSHQIEAAMSTAANAGRSTRLYSDALRLLNAELATAIQRENAARAATDATAAARAKAALGLPLSRRDQRTIVAADRTDAAAARRAQEAFRNRDAEQRQLRRRFLTEEAPGFTGPRSLTGQQRLDLGIETSARDNRARQLRRQHAEQIAASAKQRTDAIAAGVAEQKAADLARIGWIRSLRERRDRRQQEKADIAAAAMEEAKASRLSSLGWIRSLRERRKERALELEQIRQTTGLRGMFNRMGEGVFNRFLGVGAAIGGIYASGRFIVESIQADIAMQRIRNTLKSASGSARTAASDFEFLLSASKRIGFSFTQNADHFSRFAIAARTAGLGTMQTRDVFLSVMEASAAMGLSTERTGEAMLALEQMLSKGTVAAQELRLQLGNAMPAAVNTMAKALGITVRQLFTALESGAINSADAVQKFARQLRKDFELTDEANKTIRDLNRLQTAWTQLKAAVGEGLRSPLASAAEEATDLVNRLNVAINKLDELSGRNAQPAGAGGAEAEKTSPLMKALGTGLKIGTFGGAGVLYDLLHTPLMNRAVAADKAAREKMAQSTETPPPNRAGFRDAEAARLAAEAEKQSASEAKLNDLLLARIRIQDLLADKTNLSAEATKDLQHALEGVNLQLKLEQAETPKERATIRRDEARANLQRAQREFREADARVKQPGLSAAQVEAATSARAVARSTVDAANQQVRAAEEALKLTKDEKEKATKEKKPTELRGEKSLAFSLGNLGQQRPGTYTGPALFDINRQQLNVEQQQLQQLRELNRKIRLDRQTALFSDEGY